jgi:hypothetical protein
MVKSGRSSGLRKCLQHFLDRCLLAPVKDMSLGNLNQTMLSGAIRCPIKDHLKYVHFVILG